MRLRPRIGFKALSIKPPLPQFRYALFGDPFWAMVDLSLAAISAAALLVLLLMGI